MNDEHLEAEEQIVTLVEVQRKHKNRYNIYINDSYSFSIHEDVLIEHGIRKGAVITAEIEAQIREDESCSLARQQALRWIELRSYSQSELSLRLKKKQFSQKAIDQTITFLLQYNYLNDQQYAGMLAEQRIYNQKKGRNWVKQELLHKGIARDKLDEVLEGIDPEREFEAALAIATRKWSSSKDEFLPRKNKTIGFLMRRGYGSELIRKVMQEVYKSAEMDSGSVDDGMEYDYD